MSPPRYSSSDRAAGLQSRIQRLLDELTSSGAELGLQAAAYLDDELIIDAWSGTANPETRVPVTGDTLFVSYSTGKGVAATLVHVLAEHGVLDYDTPISHYWPEFAAHGKATATVRHALTHATGVPHLPADATLELICDWDAICRAIADATPLWQPGTRSQYHGWTYGWILGEVARRASGQTIDQTLDEQIARPLGIADSIFFATPPHADQRMSLLVDGGWQQTVQAMPADSPWRRSMPLTLLPTAALGNNTQYRRASIPSSVTTTARAAAKLYASLSPSGECALTQLISPARLRAATSPQREPTGLRENASGPIALGYLIGAPNTPWTAMGSRATVFGHDGSGGSIAFADPENRLSFALTKNRMTPNLDAAQLLADTIRKTLGISNDTGSTTGARPGKQPSAGGSPAAPPETPAGVPGTHRRSMCEQSQTIVD